MWNGEQISHATHHRFLVRVHACVGKGPAPQAFDQLGALTGREPA